MTVVVLMGVAGSGKSTVAALLSARLGWPFQEGDLLHPAANVAKMAAGRALTDADREPWLQLLRDWIATHRDGVVTCSALKRRYRDVLRDDHVRFALLTAPRAELAARLANRPGHFMPARLLDSQLADLEPPAADEHVIALDATEPPAQLVDRLVELIGQ